MIGDSSTALKTPRNWFGLYINELELAGSSWRPSLESFARTSTLLQVVMRPESVSWQVQRGTRVALLCGATAALTDQQLTKMLGQTVSLAVFVKRCMGWDWEKHEITFFEWSLPWNTVLTYFLTYHLEVPYVTVYSAYFFWHSFWHLFWHSIWHCIWHFAWHYILASILTFYSAILFGIHSGIYSGILSDNLSGILPGILSDILSLASGWVPAVLSKIWGSRWRSGSAHWDLELAVEARHCPLRSWACSWGPAMPTEIRHLRLKSGSAHWDLELAVGFQQCPLTLIWQLGPGSDIGWGPAVPTEIRNSQLPEEEKEKKKKEEKAKNLDTPTWQVEKHVIVQSSIVLYAHRWTYLRQLFWCPPGTV